MLANRFLYFKQYNHTIKGNQIPGKALFSLHNVKKINYEDKTKTLSIFYFKEQFPETIVNVDESVYKQIVTYMGQTGSCPEPFDGNPSNEF